MRHVLNWILQLGGSVRGLLKVKQCLLPFLGTAFPLPLGPCTKKLVRIVPTASLLCCYIWVLCKTCRLYYVDQPSVFHNKKADYLGGSKKQAMSHIQHLWYGLLQFLWIYTHESVLPKYAKRLMTCWMTILQMGSWNLCWMVFYLESFHLSIWWGPIAIIPLWFSC